ncbi:MAG: ABC transporter transmembrane domain-containing protein [Pseudomonadota bacterium]
MERTLQRFVWKNSWRDQLLIVVLSFISFPLILATLYIPKLIVDDALRGTDFPVETLFGLSFEQVEYLLALCCALLSLIVLNNGVKYVINIKKGLTGERLLRRLRFEIFSRVTRFPLRRLRASSSGETVQMISAEVEPVGGFAGDLVATPVYQGGQLLVYLGFIIAQDLVLGLAAIIFFPIQGYIVPKVQAIVVALVQRRIRNVRGMTGDISEALEGIEEMRVNSATRWHLAKISERLYVNFKLRYRIFVLKYAIKFANNVINHLTPFFFYSIGGYQVIQGNMELGALVAIIAAYKDIAAPWKELLRFYQSFSDISARYDAVVEIYAEVDETVPERVDLSDRRVTLDSAASLLPAAAGGAEEVTLALEPGGTYALIGDGDQGRHSVMRMLAGLEELSGGNVHVGDQRLTHGGLAGAWDQIAYLTRRTTIVPGSIRDNVAYGLLSNETPDESDAPDWHRRKAEAALTGALPDDPEADWTDYARGGFENAQDFDSRAIALLADLGMDADLMARGLQTRTGSEDTPEIVEAALKLRARLAEDAPDDLMNLIERWDEDAFMENLSLAENLFFSAPEDPSMRGADGAAREDLRRHLTRAGIDETLAEFGLEICEVLFDLFGSSDAPASFESRFGFFGRGEMAEFEQIVTRARKSGLSKLKTDERWRLAGVAFELTPARHRLGIFDDPARRERVIEARRHILREAGKIPGLTRFDPKVYLPGLTLIENILGGRPRIDRRDVTPSLEARLEAAMSELGARDFVISAGLHAPLRRGGGDLSQQQKRRIAMARAIVSGPKLVLLDGVFEGRDDDSDRVRAVLRENCPDVTLVIGADDPEIAEVADETYLVENGRVRLHSNIREEEATA